VGLSARAYVDRARRDLLPEQVSSVSFLLLQVLGTDIMCVC
jgi:hypothetical protein